MTKDIPLGTILHLAGVIATAVAFWMGLSGRLDVLQAKLEAQAVQIQEIKRDLDKVDDRVRDLPQKKTDSSSLETDPFRL